MKVEEKRPWIDPKRNLHQLWLFNLIFFGSIVFAVFLSFVIMWNEKGLSWSAWNSQNVDNFFALLKWPVAIGAAGLALSALIATMHRSAQSVLQFELAVTATITDNFYRHREEFLGSFESRMKKIRNSNTITKAGNAHDSYLAIWPTARDDGGITYSDDVVFALTEAKNVVAYTRGLIETFNQIDLDTDETDVREMLNSCEQQLLDVRTGFCRLLGGFESGILHSSSTDDRNTKIQTLKCLSRILSHLHNELLSLVISQVKVSDPMRGFSTLKIE